MVSLIFALKILVEEMIVVLVLDKVVIVEVVSSKSFKLAPASEAVEAVEAVVVEAEAVWRLFGLIVVIVVVESKGGKLVIELVGGSRMFLVMD